MVPWCHRGRSVPRCDLSLILVRLLPRLAQDTSIKQPYFSWYKRSEFGFRAAVFFSMATIAGAFGGLLAVSGNYYGMNEYLCSINCTFRRRVYPRWRASAVSPGGHGSSSSKGSPQLWRGRSPSGSSRTSQTRPHSSRRQSAHLSCGAYRRTANSVPRARSCA